MPVAPVTDLGTALMTSIAGALALLLAGIPKIIGFALVLIIGWIIASAVAGLVTRVLHAVRFDDLTQRAGIADLARKSGMRMTPSQLLGGIAKWFIRLIALVVAFDALGLPAVSDVLRSFLLFIPNLVVALVVLVIAGLAARALGKLVRGAVSETGAGNADMLALVAQGAVWAFAIIVAVNQIGVASVLVNTLFAAITFGLALAFGLAFGLGGRDTAAKILASWQTQAGTFAQGANGAPATAGHAAPEERETLSARIGNGRHTGG